MYNVVFIFALAYFFLFISSIPTSISPKSLTDVVKVPSALDREKTEENERDFLLIKDWHLFGNAAVEIDEHASVAGVASATAMADEGIEDTSSIIDKQYMLSG